MKILENLSLKFIGTAAMVSLLLLSHCKEEEAGEITLIRLTQESESVFRQEPWVVAYSTSGQLLDYKKIIPEEEVILKSSVPLTDGHINVALVYYVQGGAFRNHFATFYNEIATGETWTIQNPPTPTYQHERSGSFTVNLTGKSPNNHEIMLTDKYSHGGAFGETGDSFTFSSSLVPSSPKFNLIYRGSDNVLKHKMINDLKDGDVINLTVFDLERYDKEVMFNFPTGEVFLIVQGFEQGQPYTDLGYLLNFHLFGDHAGITAGYTSTLVKYITSLSVDYPTYSYGYGKIGGIPGNITFPNPASFINDDVSLANYKAVADPSWRYRKSIWKQVGADATATWTIYSPSLTQKMADLPAEVLAVHGPLTMAQQQFESTTFYTGSDTYSATIDRTFKGGSSEFESISVVKE